MTPLSLTDFRCLFGITIRVNDEEKGKTGILGLTVMVRSDSLSEFFVPHK